MFAFITYDYLVCGESDDVITVTSRSLRHDPLLTLSSAVVFVAI